MGVSCSREDPPASSKGEAANEELWNARGAAEWEAASGALSAWGSRARRTAAEESAARREAASVIASMIGGAREEAGGGGEGGQASRL